MNKKLFSFEIVIHYTLRDYIRIDYTVSAPFFQVQIQFLLDFSPTCVYNKIRW